jgi:trans-aconitate 2-methyltransferase
MSNTDWNPDQYGRFRDERRQPFLDLLALVQPRSGMRVVDLGCGTGELTRLLHDRLQARETLGLDSSTNMLERSHAFAGNGVHFEHGDLTAFAPTAPYDLVFSNATLQWTPAHRELLRRLTTLLCDGGQLAVQVPANHDHPSHVIAAEVAAEGPFRSALGDYVRIPSVLLPEEYAALLDALGYREQHVRMQVYVHHLPSRGGVIEWMKGTTLLDYQKRMPPELFAQFLERYQARLLPHLSDTCPYFYPFKRILFWGLRPA